MIREVIPGRCPVKSVTVAGIMIRSVMNVG